ncbi:MAG: hypothetical protein V1908_02570 [Candidatus Peregrinibacteria bacterium]
MPDDSSATATAVASKINVPTETREQFPDLIPLIVVSPSMNDEERQYWVDVLPIMTEDQVKNLRDILSNEKKQIDEANSTYAKGVQKEKEKVGVVFNEAAYKAKKQALKEAEKVQETEEAKSEDELLKEIGEIPV